MRAQAMRRGRYDGLPKHDRSLCAHVIIRTNHSSVFVSLEHCAREVWELRVESKQEEF